MLDPDTYPRTLHVGFTEFGAPNSTSLTLQRAFAGWPADRLLQACVRPTVPGPGVITLSGPVQQRIDAAFNRLLSRSAPVSGGGLAMDQQQRLARQARYIVSMAGDLRPVLLPRSVVASIDAFDPHIIHCTVSGVRSMRIALGLSRKLGVPVLPHFMDDWPSVLFKGVPLNSLARREAQRTLRQLLDTSPRVLVVGRDMQEEYQDRYGVECSVVGNCADPAAAHSAVGPQLPGLTYVGGLENNRWLAISNVAQMLHDVPVRLFTPPAHAARASQLSRRHATIIAEGTAPPDDVPSLLAKCQALLFVESSREPARAYTRLSVSGKVAQYLLSRRPILAVGPRGQSSIRALSQSPLCVYAGDDLSRERLTQATQVLWEQGKRPIPSATWADLLNQYGCSETRQRLLRALAGAE